MPPIDDNQAAARGQGFWRSLAALANAPEHQQRMAREFPTADEETLNPGSRREFLKLAGASLALAGLVLTGCRWPKEKILPYSTRPAGLLPGHPEQYATAMELGGWGVGLLATSYDGRPIKVDGNPEHPVSLGGSNAMHQASVLGLYDPDRAQRILRRDGNNYNTATWDEFLAFAQPHFASLRGRQGRGLALLSDGSRSPSLAAQRAWLAQHLPQARWTDYSPVSWANQAAGFTLLGAAPHRAHYDVAGADVILSLDDDFLHLHPASLRYVRDFAARRNPANGKLNRLYMAESTYSITGAQADHRLPLRSADVAALAAVLAAELFINRGLPAPGATTSLLELLDARGVLEGFASHALNTDIVKALAADLLAARGHGLIAAGPRMPAPVHALAYIMNTALGNAGKTVSYLPEPDGAAAGAAGLRTLVDELNGGKVDTLLILGGNPAYDAPGDVDFASASAKAPVSISLCSHHHETARLCTWQVNQAHYLEAWGDNEAWDGTVGVVQPLIAPLYDGKSAIELVALACGDSFTSGYDIVRRTQLGPAAAEQAWRRIVHDGLVHGSGGGGRASVLALDYGALITAVTTLANAPGEMLELNIYPHEYIYDGQFANNGWLQELPDPLTKLTWGNAALLSPADAKRLGIQHDDVLKLELNGAAVELPAYILPGQAPGTVAVHIGFGRGDGKLGNFGDARATHPPLKLFNPPQDYSSSPVGRVGDGIGVNVYPLRRAGNPHYAMGVQLTRTGKRHTLAVTQDHHIIDTVGMEERGRRAGELVRSANVAFYEEHPEFAKQMTHHPPLTSLWKEYTFDGPHWAMAIDLAQCIGCGACTAACQAENNIPVVGREQVITGREMHWIRVDRYFKGDEQNPEVAQQPLACQQCELAPCESVCPVAATSHTKEGLNDMVYNRCVGTRYCSNNCPYKVRRFNYFEYRKDLTETEKLQFNPEVTIRKRGVMEKCTFCVQRIQKAKIIAKNTDRPIQDGDITPACAQACPAQAIVFGDLRDKDSRVRKLFEDNRSYALLEELNTKPRNMFLARLCNPAPGTAAANEPGPRLYGHASGAVAKGDESGAGESKPAGEVE
jgi:MoCo/4Fe-4S cofactor protein with predicted Tat translocation signal